VSYVQRGPVASTGKFQTICYDFGEGRDDRRYKLGKYGQRVEIIPDWAERGERFAPDDPRSKIETSDIVHDHNSQKQMEKLQ
jgi:hypothetical protein